MARRSRHEDDEEPRKVARADDLFGLPLDQFTAARDRLARSLKADGDPDAAAQVKALRKPMTTVWAVNQLVRRHPRQMEAFFKAGDRLRAAQRGALGPRGAEELRAASEELRARMKELVAAVEELLEGAGARADLKALEAVREILQAAPTAPDRERRRLERGTLTEPLKPAAFSDVLAMMRGGARGKLRLLPPPEEKKKEDPRAARRAAEEARAQRLSQERERALARRETKRAEEEARAQRVQAERERARQAEARRARDEARKAAAREGRAAERAAATAERAAEAAERAEEAARRAREQADATAEAAETARARAAEAEQRLAEAEAELLGGDDAPVRAIGRGGRR